MLFRRALFLLAALASAPAPADPALWVAKSPTAIVHLFGTVHVLPEGISWRYPLLDAALNASGELYVEENDDSAATMRNLVQQFGLVGTPGTTSDDMRTCLCQEYLEPAYALSSKLGPRDRARLEAAANTVDGSGGLEAFEHMRPWLAAVALTVAPIEKAGYTPGSGADVQLKHQFQATGRPVDALETAREQIQSLARLPATLQLDLLHDTLDDYAKGPGQIQAQVSAWQAGDVAAIAKNVDADMQNHYPQLYTVLLVKRNRNFAHRIAPLLKGHQTAFVAIGAGHLAGPDSVQAQLARLGIRTERVH